MKKSILVVCIMLCFVGCGRDKQVDYGEKNNQNYDSQNFSTTREAISSDNGFYTIKDDSIYFVDVKSGKTVPICGKPNCEHKDKTCNAYFDIPINIQKYNGYLYVVARGSKERTESLYRMSLDGSEREELKVLYCYEDGDESCSLDFVIHRGYGYMVTNWLQSDRKEKTQTMYRITLDKSEEKETIVEVTGYTPLIYISEGVGNHIYYSTSRYIDVDAKNMESLTYSLDIRDGKITKLNLPEGVSFITEKNGRTYCYQKDGTGIISVNKDGKDIKQIFTWKYDSTWIMHDEKYVYVDNEGYLIAHDCPYTQRRICIIDYEGNKICEWKKFGENKIQWSDNARLLLMNIKKDTYEILKFSDLSQKK